MTDVTHFLILLCTRKKHLDVRLLFFYINKLEKSVTYGISCNEPRLIWPAISDTALPLEKL